MIRETGLLVEMVGQRNAEAVQQRMNRIAGVVRVWVAGLY